MEADAVALLEAAQAGLEEAPSAMEIGPSCGAEQAGGDTAR